MIRARELDEHVVLDEGGSGLRAWTNSFLRLLSQAQTVSWVAPLEWNGWYRTPDDQAVISTLKRVNKPFTFLKVTSRMERFQGEYEPGAGGEEGSFGR